MSIKVILIYPDEHPDYFPPGTPVHPMFGPSVWHGYGMSPVDDSLLTQGEIRFSPTGYSHGLGL
ncbi:MAG: hypothetical protein WA239_02420, partial [Candidatus Sulfotelmatobacter sp.]